MGLMNIILNKSNSYKYYKSQFLKFSKEEREYKNKISYLQNQLKTKNNEISKLKKRN